MTKPTLRELRKQKDLTQQELASALKLSISTITSIETGRHPPRLDVARKIARYFQVGIDDIDWPERDDDPKANPVAA